MPEFIVFDDIDKYGPKTYERRFPVSAKDVSREEVANLGDVALTVQASKGDLTGEYILQGTADFTADLECSRCVEPYPFAITSTFHLRYRARPAGSGEELEEVEISADELDIEYYSERQISLKDLAMEQIQLSIPMKPLCGEKCLGLCPTCGANRNLETCRCESSIIDERWGTLRDVRAELLKKKES